MSVRDIRIERLNIVLHGVSSLVAEQALTGLEDELRLRLGGLRGSWRGAAIPSLHVGPYDLPPGADAAAIRQLVAQRFLETLFRPSVSDITEVE